jgi:hypothetical protein
MLTGYLPGKQLVFVTNNSTKSRADYKKKFDKMGITASEVCADTLHFHELGTTADTHNRKKSSAPPTAPLYTLPVSSNCLRQRTKCSCLENLALSRNWSLRAFHI